MHRQARRGLTNFCKADAVFEHAYNESDESVCERWAESVYFQYFCGEDYFQPRLPCDPTNLVRFRQALGEAGVEELGLKEVHVAARTLQKLRAGGHAGNCV
ncbi:transposase [Paraburkholderia aspalathi]|uniref:transposase n=1 Tax=Paraburkholderia aspalathi TaxID=1324617 RepID=UPI0035592793